MPSKVIQDSYLLIDHRAVERGTASDSVPAGSMLELKIYSCSHCQRQIVRNPIRFRPRAYCPKCDHYICDECEIVRVANGGACRPFKQVIDEALNAASKGQPIGDHIWPSASSR